MMGSASQLDEMCARDTIGLYTFGVLGVEADSGRAIVPSVVPGCVPGTGA